MVSSTGPSLAVPSFGRLDPVWEPRTAAARPSSGAPPTPGAGPAFAPLPGTGPRPGLLIAGRIWSRRRLLARARAARAAGRVVTLLILSPTARPHRLALTDDGIWLQEGGLFGRSDRNGPMFRFTTFAARLREEAEIAARTRFVA